MNQFTKDELLIIHLDMTIYAQKTKLLKESPSHKALRDKIHSMIDNCCEHNRPYTKLNITVCLDCGVLVPNPDKIELEAIEIT